MIIQSKFKETRNNNTSISSLQLKEADRQREYTSQGWNNFGPSAYFHDNSKLATKKTIDVDSTTGIS